MSANNNHSNNQLPGAAAVAAAAASIITGSNANTIPAAIATATATANTPTLLNGSGAGGSAVGSNSGGGDLWRECVAWLTRCHIIPTDHMANSPNAEIRVLALTLRDGVLLCNLILFLDPSCMDASDFTRRPQMAQVINIQRYIPYIGSFLDFDTFLTS